MKATVTKVDNGAVKVRVRRSPRSESLYRPHWDLAVGDKVEVKRVINNPYLVRVPKGDAA